MPPERGRWHRVSAFGFPVDGNGGRPDAGFMLGETVVLARHIVTERNPQSLARGIAFTLEAPRIHAGRRGFEGAHVVDGVASEAGVVRLRRPA